MEEERKDFRQKGGYQGGFGISPESMSVRAKNQHKNDALLSYGETTFNLPGAKCEH
jgi:hypothetical protein